MSRAKTLRCVRCHETKAYDQFVNDRTRNSGKFPWCRPCTTEARRATRERDNARPFVPTTTDTERKCPGCLTSLAHTKANRVYCTDKCKGRVRGWAIFGLTPDDYRALLAATDGKCPICQRKVKRWTTDHNHATGETLGIVCSVCNQSLLAYSRHDLETVRRLSEFIANPPVRTVIGEPRYVGPDGLDQMERATAWRTAHDKWSVGLAASPAKASAA